MKHKEKYFLFLGTLVKSKPMEVISYSVYHLDGTHLRVVVVRSRYLKHRGENYGKRTEQPKTKQHSQMI